jgi:cytochrome c oxidase subunit 2
VPSGKDDRMKKAKRMAIVFGLALVLSGCSNSSTFLRSASPISRDEAHLYEIVLGMSIVVLLIVYGLLIYNIIHFRSGLHDFAVPDQHYRHSLIESIYTGIPLVAVTVLFILTVYTMDAVAAPPPQKSDLNVQVVAHQWWWEFDYPDLGIVTANEMHIPINTNVHISLVSADVVHSFWVPALAGKTDVIPGVTNHMWMKGDKIGEYWGQCAEYCGLDHANMRLRVFVDTKDTFDAWVNDQQQPPAQPQTDLQEQGYDLIVNGICSGCHTLGDHQAALPIGPNLTHLFSRTTFAGSTFDLNETNLQHWLQDTQAMKPGNNMKHVELTPDQINALVACLTMLK